MPSLKATLKATFSVEQADVTVCEVITRGRECQKKKPQGIRGLKISKHVAQARVSGRSAASILGDSRK